MNTLKVDLEQVQARVNKLKQLEKRYNDVLNNNSFLKDFPLTVNSIRMERNNASSPIRDCFTKNISYLLKILTDISELDHKYSIIEPTDYATSSYEYNTRYINTAIDYDLAILGNLYLPGAVVGTLLKIYYEKVKLNKKAEMKHQSIEDIKPIDKSVYEIKKDKGFWNIIKKMYGSKYDKDYPLVDSSFGIMGLVMEYNERKLKNTKEYGTYTLRAGLETVTETTISYGIKTVSKNGGLIGGVVATTLDTTASIIVRKKTGQDKEEYISDTIVNYIGKLWKDVGPDAVRGGSKKSQSYNKGGKK